MELDRTVDRVAKRKDDWAALATSDRLSLLRRCTSTWIDAAPAIVRAGRGAKGLRFGTPEATAEWLSGPVPVIRNLRPPYPDVAVMSGCSPM